MLQFNKEQQLHRCFHDEREFNLVEKQTFIYMDVL